MSELIRKHSGLEQDDPSWVWFGGIKGINAETSLTEGDRDGGASRRSCFLCLSPAQTRLIQHLHNAADLVTPTPCALIQSVLSPSPFDTVNDTLPIIITGRCHVRGAGFWWHWPDILEKRKGKALTMPAMPVQVRAVMNNWQFLTSIRGTESVCRVCTVARDNILGQDILTMGI